MEKTLHETPEEGDVIEVVFQNSTSVFVVLKAEVVAWSTHHLLLDLLLLVLYFVNLRLFRKELISVVVGIIILCLNKNAYFSGF